jgi:hypothetical protein
MPRYKITSQAKGPRVVRPIDGPTKTLQPGQSVTADIAEPHLLYLERSGDFVLKPVVDGPPTAGVGGEVPTDPKAYQWAPLEKPVEPAPEPHEASTEVLERPDDAAAGIQLPTIDAVTGEPIPPAAELHGEPAIDPPDVELPPAGEGPSVMGISKPKPETKPRRKAKA